MFLLSLNRWTITILNEQMAPDALYRRILQERFPFACSPSWTSPVQFKSINWYAFQKDYLGEGFAWSRIPVEVGTFHSG